MLKNLQSVFRDAWQAFHAELGRREPEDEVAELLRLMRREMVDARAALPVLDEAVRETEAELTAERKAIEQCLRRQKMAERIADAETARVATEFAERHQARAEVLEQKLDAVRAEREMRGREVEEMMRRYKEADANRFALLAQLRRARASEGMQRSLDSEQGTFADFARMEEAIRSEATYADAVEELSDAAPSESGEVAEQPSAGEIEERLRELKRRMGRG